MCVTQTHIIFVYLFLPQNETEEVRFDTSDGVNLYGMWIPGDADMPVIVISHGRYMCLGKYEAMLPMNVLHQRGYK